MCTAACTKETSKNPLPTLTYNSYSVLQDSAGKDNLILVNLSYTDGDGNIGLEEYQTQYPFGDNDPFHNNLFIYYYVEQGGVFKKVSNPLSPSNDTINFHERIGNLTPTGKSKWIYGDLQLKIPANPFNIDPSKVKFECQLVDRDLNKSNLVATPVVEVKL
jgi:hypothetical protein